MSERLYDHRQVSTDERAHFLRPKHRLKTLLRLRLNLRVIVLKQLAIRIHQVDEASWRVLDGHALRTSKLF